ncbi:hypothetical protein MUS1_05830, partial [Marinomonas ushuaiensis DSM 15871]
MSDSQTSFETSGTAIGVITKLSGSVTITSIDGQERVAQVGDSVFFGETVVTGANGSVTISFIDGTDVVIGPDSVVEITDEVYNTGDAEELVADSVAEAEALQAAILAGDDPTLVQDAPAAGDDAENQDRVDVSVERIGGDAPIGYGMNTLPTYGYDTGKDATERSVTQFSAGSSGPSDAIAGVVTINTITSDGVISSEEASGTVTVSGSANGGDISTGDSVVFVINNVTYSTSVSADGTWSVDVAGSDLATDTSFDVVVTSSNSDGNTVESISTATYEMDQSKLLVNLDIDPITEDSVVNAAEASSTVTVTGIVTGDEFDSGEVTLVINGAEYKTEVNVEDGGWSVEVDGNDLTADADTIVFGTVSVGNSIGQEGDATSTEKYFVDTAASAIIRVDSITEDDLVNATESESTVTVSGRVAGDVSLGDLVSMTINGTSYTALVLANSTWSVDVSGSDLAADTSFVATVTGEDNAGNSYSASTTSTHTVDAA